MTAPLNTGPTRFKLKFAQNRLATLGARIREWQDQSTSSSFVFRERGEMGHAVMRYDGEAPGEEILAELVELALHLRSALDTMIEATVEARGRGRGGTGFPFGSSDGSEPFPTKTHLKLQNKLSEAQWAIVLQSKPFLGGNNVLWSINEIANIHKHRNDIVRVSLAQDINGLTVMNGIFLAEPEMFSDNYPDAYDDSTRELVFMSYGFAQGCRHPDIIGKPSVRLVFGGLKAVAGLDMITTIRRQAIEVEQIVEAFERTPVE